VLGSVKAIAGVGNPGTVQGLFLPADSPLRDASIADRCRLLPHFASAARITRLSSDPDKGMAGRCVQGLIDVLEGNYGGDVTKMPYVVNKEAFVK